MPSLQLYGEISFYAQIPLNGLFCFSLLRLLCRDGTAKISQLTALWSSLHASFSAPQSNLFLSLHVLRCLLFYLAKWCGDGGVCSIQHPFRLVERLFLICGKRRLGRSLCSASTYSLTSVGNQSRFCWACCWNMFSSALTPTGKHTSRRNECECH